MKHPNVAGLPRIPLCMRDGWLTLVVTLVLSSCLFAAEGMFQGEIVDPPGQKPAVAGWIFVQGRNRMVRRVDVARAVIVPEAGTSSGSGKKCGPECLAVGQEVRVTAEQDGYGEWHARRVEILRSTAPKGSTISLRSSPGGSDPRRTARRTDPSAALGISPAGTRLANFAHARRTAQPYETLPSRPSAGQGSWITTPIRLCIQPLTEKSIITRWSGGIMNDVL